MQVTSTEPQQKQQDINVIHGLDGVLYMTQQTYEVTRSIQFRERIPSPMTSSQSAELANCMCNSLVKAAQKVLDSSVIQNLSEPRFSFFDQLFPVSCPAYPANFVKIR